MRRNQLKLASLAVAAATGNLLPTGAAAAEDATAPGKPLVNVGIYGYGVGELTVTAIQDGGFAGPPLERVVTNAEFLAVQAALANAFQPTDRFPITFTTLIVKTGQHIVAIDAGAADIFGATSGRLPAGSAAAGIDPAKVDVVLLSHLQTCPNSPPLKGTS